MYKTFYQPFWRNEGVGLVQVDLVPVSLEGIRVERQGYHFHRWAHLVSAKAERVKATLEEERDSVKDR